MANLQSNMESRKTGRREFLRAAARLPLLAVLVATGGMLMERRRESGAVCTRDFVCRECQSLAACNLPQAAIFKSSKTP